MLYKTIKTIAVLIIISSGLAAQNPKIDSIKKVLSQENINSSTLNELLVCIKKPELSSSPNVDSIASIILKKFKDQENNVGICNTLEYLATINFKRGNFSTALQFHKEYLQNIPEENLNTPQHAITLRMLSSDYFNLGSFDSAIVYAKKAIEAYSYLNDSQNIARSLNLLGGIYWNKGSLKKASETLYESLKIKEKFNDTIGMANVYNNIGLIFDSQDKFSAAMEMYQKSLNLYTLIDNYQGVGRVCNNIAIIQKNQGKLNESLEMFLKSLEVDKKLNNIDEQGKTLNNIGQLYLELKNTAKGVEYFNEAKKAFEQSGNENGLTAVYINLGRAKLMERNFSNSQFYYLKALDLAKTIGSNEWIRDSYEGLYQVAKKTGRSLDALNYFEGFKQLDDTLRNVENLNKLDQLKVEYESEQKEKEITLLSKDNELNLLQLKKQKYYTFFFISISLSILVILALSVVYAYHLKHDKKLLLLKNAEITQQKEEIESQRDLLETSNIELNQQKEELLSQAEQIERQNQYISGINRRMTESIEYASLIQQSILPDISILDTFFNQRFLLFKPKDIVSGDLYWMWEDSKTVIFAVADCTGHGVAGAFMSIMSMSLLKDAIVVKRMDQPSEISSYLYNELSKSRYSDTDTYSVIGVDFVVCKYSIQTHELSYSGNHMNFILLQNGAIELVKIGRIFEKDSKDLKFPVNSIKLKKGDRLYLFTDGYTDQLSGVKRKKMGRGEFQNLILSMEKLPLETQAVLLDDFFTKWKGSFEQVDDVLILGLEV